MLHRTLPLEPKPYPVSSLAMHGESGVAESFSDLVRQKLGWNSRAPKDGESVVL